MLFTYGKSFVKSKKKRFMTPLPIGSRHKSLMAVGCLSVYLCRAWLYVENRRA